MFKRWLWIVAGNEEGEGILKRACAMQAAHPAGRHTLLTTCADYKQWPGRDTYHIDIDQADEGRTARRVDQKARRLVVAAWEEGLLDAADIVITTSWYGALLAHYLGSRGKRLGEFPIVYLSGKVPEAGDNDDLDNRHFADFARLAAADAHVWTVVNDNDHEAELMAAHLAFANPSSKGRTLRRYVGYRFKAHTTPWPSRNAVAWSGRFGVYKNPRLAAEVAALLPRSIERHAFVPMTASSRRAELETFSTLWTVHQGMNAADYVANATSCKVLLVTSTMESLGRGYLELIDRGVIPVVWRRPWNRTWIGPDWPLLFDTPGEAAVMIVDALSRPDRYRHALREALATRYAAPPNWPTIVESISRHHQATAAYRRKYSPTHTNARIGI